MTHLSPRHLFQGLMHSYREAFEDDEADGFDNIPAFGGGGENSPQTPSFPVSPQTPYFNMCRFTPPADRELSRTFSMRYSLLAYFKQMQKNIKYEKKERTELPIEINKKNIYYMTLSFFIQFILLGQYLNIKTKLLEYDPKNPRSHQKEKRNPSALN